MSYHEKTGKRDLTYSNWHRPKQIARYLDWLAAQQLHYIDVDCLEYCARCREPLALVETAMDKGQRFKQTVVTERLGAKAGIPVYLLFYSIGAGEEITAFRAMQLSPDRRDLGLISPEQWALRLWKLRQQHRCADGGRLLGVADEDV